MYRQYIGWRKTPVPSALCLFGGGKSLPFSPPTHVPEVPPPSDNELLTRKSWRTMPFSAGKTQDPSRKRGGWRRKKRRVAVKAGARSVAALSRGLSNIEWRRQGASKELLSKKTTNELVKLMMQVCIMSFHGFACMYERRAVKCEVCGVQ